MIICYPFDELGTTFHLLHLLKLFSPTITKTKASLFYSLDSVSHKARDSNLNEALFILLTWVMSSEEK